MPFRFYSNEVRYVLLTAQNAEGNTVGCSAPVRQAMTVRLDTTAQRHRKIGGYAGKAVVRGVMTCDDYVVLQRDLENDGQFDVLQSEFVTQARRPVTFSFEVRRPDGSRVELKRLAKVKHVPFHGRASPWSYTVLDETFFDLTKAWIDEPTVIPIIGDYIQEQVWLANERALAKRAMGDLSDVGPDASPRLVGQLGDRRGSMTTIREKLSFSGIGGDPVDFLCEQLAVAASRIERAVVEKWPAIASLEEEESNKEKA